jgi:hypothetical protein
LFLRLNFGAKYEHLLAVRLSRSNDGGQYRLSSSYEQDRTGGNSSCLSEKSKPPAEWPAASKSVSILPQAAA